MSQPTAYAPVHAFITDQSVLPDFPGQELDVEFAAVEETTDQIRTNLALIQRDDGALKNGVVTFDSLSSTLQTAGLAPLTQWATSTRYDVPQAVLFGSKLYQVAAGHTSGVFATDLAAGDWTFLTDLSLLSGVVTVAANLVAAGPTSGSAAVPTFRALVLADIPGSIPNSKLANSTVTIGSTSVALGATAATIAGLTLTAPVLGAALASSLNINGATLGANKLAVNGASLLGVFAIDALGNVSVDAANTSSNVSYSVGGRAAWSYAGGTGFGGQAMLVQASGGLGITGVDQAILFGVAAANQRQIWFPTSDTVSGGTVAIGLGALNSLTTVQSYVAVGIGYHAATGAANSSSRFVAIGGLVAQSATQITNSVIMGTEAASHSANIASAVIIGDTAVASAYTNLSNMVAIGNEAGNGPSGSIATTVVIGNLAQLGNPVTMSNTTAVGHEVLRYNGGSDNAAYGYHAGYGDSGVSGTLRRSTLIGSGAASLSTAGDNQIVIGYNQQASSATVSDYLNIGGAIKGSIATGSVALSITGSLTLGTVSSITGGLKLAHASSAFLTTIQAGNAAAARTYTWPTNFGSAGDALTDAAGDGTLSWAAAGGSSTLTSVPKSANYTTIAGNLGKSIDNTTGGSDVTTTLLSAATAGAGALQYVKKIDSGAGKVIVSMAEVVTMTIATPCVVTMPGSAFAEQTPIVFTTTGALPTGLTAGTTYYTSGVSGATFNVSATPGGAAIATSGSQSGVHTGSVAMAWLSTQADSVAMRSNGSVWVAHLWMIAPRRDYYSTAGATTWVKPPLARTLRHITAIGGAGGGASGAQCALASNSSGGGGGAPGGIDYRRDMLASVYSATEPVVVGAGGTGGASQATPSTAGNVGSITTASSFSTGTKAVKAIASLTAPAGGAIAGAAVGGTAAFGRQFNFTGTAGTNGGVTTPSIVQTGLNFATIFPGGCGAGSVNITSVNTNGSGSGGTASSWWGDTPAVGGIASTKTSPVTGIGGLWDSGLRLGGSGGGGWSASDGTAGNGGNGSSPGGAGGGGGSSVDGANSGAGGNGADGAVEIITAF